MLETYCLYVNHEIGAIRMTTTSAPSSSADAPARSVAETAAGPIAYRDLGSGEPILFVHGLLVDGRLWDGVVERLRADFRCIIADWPMGSHRMAMKPRADLTPPGMAEVVAGFMDAVGLERATIVGNDSGGAVSQMLAATHPERFERLVLTNCDTFEHFPPFPFNLLPPLARIPGGIHALAAPFKIGPVRRATYGLLARHPIDPALVDSWLAAIADPGVRDDTRRFTAGVHKRQTIEAAERLRDFDRPLRFAWGRDDRFFRPAHAERLAAQVPGARIEWIEDAGTFVPLDQPERVADLIAGFMREA